MVDGVFRSFYNRSRVRKDFVDASSLRLYARCATWEKQDMDAIIGKYRVHMEENGLVLGHVSGIKFDLTVDEAVGLMDFLNAYRQTLSALQEDHERHTDPCLERVVVSKKDENS
jgi:hypothetical protein